MLVNNKIIPLISSSNSQSIFTQTKMYNPFFFKPLTQLNCAATVVNASTMLHIEKCDCIHICKKKKKKQIAFYPDFFF